MVSYYNSLGSMFPGAPSAPAPPSRNQGSNPTPPGATYFNPYAPGANYHPQSANHHSGAFAPGNPYVPQQFTGQTPSDMYFGFENAGSTGHWGQHHPSANAGLNTLPTTEASSTAPASSSSWFGPETWAPPPSPPTCQQQASFDQSASSESPVYSSGSSYQFGSAPPPTPPPAAAEDSPPDVSLPASSLSPPPSSAAPSSAAGGRPQPARSPFQWMKKPPGSSGVLPGIGGGPGGPEKSGKGRTRTKDKYRVVYTDHQRLELEKEFHYSRYITIRRKAELANNVGLSERQVKIWFQNRRAKERRSIKKSDDPKESGKLSPDSLVGSYPDIPQIPQHQQLPGSALHPMAFNPGAHLPGGPQPHFPPLKYE